MQRKCQTGYIVKDVDGNNKYAPPTTNEHPAINKSPISFNFSFPYALNHKAYINISPI